MLSSVQGTAPFVSVLTTTLQSLASMSYHPTQFVRQLNNSFSQQVPLVVMHAGDIGGDCQE